MKYFESTEHEVKVRIDEDADQGFIKTNGDEIEVDKDDRIINDAIIEGNEITEEEYNVG